MCVCARGNRQKANDKWGKYAPLMNLVKSEGLFLSTISVILKWHQNRKVIKMRITIIKSKSTVLQMNEGSCQVAHGCSNKLGLL